MYVLLFPSAKPYSPRFSQIPNDLDSDDILTFNITLLLPQPGPAIKYSSFATMLPLFHQHYGNLSPTIKFRQVFLGGPKSTVLADVSFPLTNMIP